MVPEGSARHNNVCDDDPHDFIYQNLPQRHILRQVPNCSHCHALRFQYETPRFCCRKGKVQICIQEVPEELKRLFTSQVDVDAKYFRKSIRYINLHLSFTSIGVTIDRRYSSPAATGHYTLRIHGDNARHLQLYFYDTKDANLTRRVKRSPDLDIKIIRQIL